EFQSKFGDTLQPEFLPNGYLRSFTGQRGSGSRSGRDFDVKDPQKRIERATEILNAAQDLIGYDSRFPLGSPASTGSSATADVVFQETINGLPVYPGGTVSIDLGADGEPLGLYSNYARDVNVTNEPTLDPDQARQIAQATVSNPGITLAFAPKDGQKIIWTH